MKLGLRLFFGFFLITGLAAFFVMRVFVAEVQPSVREVMEDLMVDTANILAELAADDLSALPEGSDLRESPFARRLEAYRQRPVNAQIWGLTKQSLDYRVYVTNARGRVVFDTGDAQGRSALGQDYSRWIDVARTLKGQYGARASRDDPAQEASAVMYVAAPIRSGGPSGAVIGVLTVAKPMSKVKQFVNRAERTLLQQGFWLLALSMAVGLAVTAWLVLSVRRLRAYARRVQWDKRESAPQLAGELGELAKAMESMRERLDGHAHVEQLVRALTHELKSPLTAIEGAAEFLGEDLTPTDRTRFAEQVRDQAERLRQLVERLLELSKLEQRHALSTLVPVDLAACTAQVLQGHQARIQQKGLQVQRLGPDGPCMVRGEPELLCLGLGNLLDNAIDFSPPGAVLQWSAGPEPQTGHGASVQHRATVWRLRDHGPGVPPGLMARLGERFFSTARPAQPGETPRKGSGLGLAIVQQVAQLHGATFGTRHAEPGFEVWLAWPLDA
jgi:two-component system sensor histidine kinase CreC